MKLRTLLTLALHIGLASTVFGATFTSSASGNWNVGTTWGGACAAGCTVGVDFPGAGDIVIIATTHTVNVNVGAAATTVTVNGSGILNMNTAATTLAISGALTLNGTSQIQGVGANRVINAGTLTASGTNIIQDVQINIGGLATVTGTLTFNTGSAASKAFGSMTVNNGTVNIAFNNITLGIVGALTLSGTPTIQGASNTRIISAGSMTVSGGGSAIIQQVQLNITGLVQVDGVLTFNTGIATKTFGSLTINGTFTNTVFVNPITINGSMVNNGTFSQGTGRVTFTGATSNTVTGTAATTAFGGGITINKGVSQANIIDVQCVITMVNGGLILTNGTFELTSASTIVPFTADPLFGASARLWCNGGTMNSTVSINWTFNGTLQVSAGTVNFGFAIDDRLFANNGSVGLIQVDGGALNVTGRIRGGSNYNYVQSNGVVTLGTLGSTGFYPFTMDNAGSQFTMTGGTMVIRRPQGTFGYKNISATGTFTGGTLQIGDGSTPAGQTIGIDTTVPIYNLTVNGFNSPIAQVQTQAITVSKDVTISAGGTLTANNLDITVGGNWTNNGTFTPTTPAVGVTFNSATASQTIGGTTATSFYRLVLNNTFATIPQFVLGRNATATNTLTMTSGVVNMAGFSFTISNSVAGSLVHSLASTVGWMYGGNFVRAVPTTAIVIGVLPANNVDGLFPMGTSVDFRPFYIGKSNTALSNGNVTLSHTAATTVATVSINDVSAGTTIVSRRDDSWTVAHTGTTGTYGIRYGGTGLGVVFSLGHLHSCLAASVVATHVAATSVSLSDPRVERSALTLANFTNTFYVGSDNGLSSLPIELLSFSAELQSGKVALNWRTESELNNDFFIVQKTTDAEAFEDVVKVKGAGTTTTAKSYSTFDYQSLPGKWYYRLKQTDFDGNSSYTKLVKVDVPESLTWSVYPNPFNGTEFNVGFSPGDIGKSAFIKLHDINGKELLLLVVESLNSTQVKVEMPQALSSGIYVISLGVEQQVVRQKLMVR